MATEEQYKQALIKAHRAGDTQAANLFASKIKEIRASQATPLAFSDVPQVVDGEVSFPEGRARTDELEVPRGDFIDSIVEPLKSVSSAVAGSIVGGYKGIADLLSGGDIDSAVKVLQESQAKLASQPKTQEGQRSLQVIQNSIDDIEKAFNFAAGGTAGLFNLALQPSQGLEGAMREAAAVSDQGFKAVGQEVLERTGSPLAATSAEIAPDLAGLFTGRAIGSSLDGTRSMPSGPVKLPQDRLVQTSDELNVPLLTTDVFPPQSFLGKWVSGKSDQLGALGSGSARLSQQRAREDLLNDLSSEYNIAFDSPFFEQVVGSLSKRNARILELGNMQRRKAIGKLSEYGPIEFKSTLAAVDEIVKKETRLGEKADNSIIEGVRSYANALEGMNFDDAAAIRTRLIQARKDLETSAAESKTPLASAYRDLKMAIDEDLQSFAKANDRSAAANWVKSNRNLAEQLETVKQTELKRLIQKGEVKPELVSTILRSGNRSELRRLSKNLGIEGRKAARAAIIRDLLDKAGAFRVDSPVNVNKFTTELSKTNTRQAIDSFFSENQKKQLESLERILEATRRAQDSALNTRTGQELVPLGAFSAAGYGLNVSPITTLATAGTMSALLKAYESKPFRQLLMKIARTKKGSKEERRILETAIPSAYAAQMAATEQQQQRQ